VPGSTPRPIAASHSPRYSSSVVLSWWTYRPVLDSVAEEFDRLHLVLRWSGLVVALPLRSGSLLFCASRPRAPLTHSGKIPPVRDRLDIDDQRDVVDKDEPVTIAYLARVPSGPRMFPARADRPRRHVKTHPTLLSEVGWRNPHRQQRSSGAH